MTKGYKVNGVDMVITEEIAQTFIDVGATVEIVKPKINKKRTRFETLVAPSIKAGFNYLVSTSGATGLSDLTNSTSLCGSKKELYALIEDQVENGADASTPAIYFMERGTGGKVLFGMHMVQVGNEFTWVDKYTDESIDYPVETPVEAVEETEETEQEV